MILLHKKVRTFYKTNQTLIKYRRTKKTRIRAGDILIIEDVHSLIKQKEIIRQQLSERSVKGDIVQIRTSGLRHCRRCDKTNHNVRICQEVEETSEKDSDIEDN